MLTSTVKYLGGLRTECTHVKSGQKIITDPPVDNHGKGEAFSPTDLAATSLATCMMTVMGIAAQGRGIEIEDMEAEVTKIMSAAPRKISKIVINMTIRGNKLTQAEKNILEEIGRSCPVALSLHPDLEQDITFRFE